ncbi:MAG: hypothetical protein K0R45_1171 [Pseudomonas sp.]|nr:hypothetical protein [Pseudomonas sp.]
MTGDLARGLKCRDASDCQAVQAQSVGGSRTFNNYVCPRRAPLLID